MLIRGYRYPEIRDLYVHQLAHVRVTGSVEATRINIEKKIDSFVKGDLAHAAEALSALWKIVNDDGSVAAPSNTSYNVNSFISIVFLVLFKVC